MSTMTHIFFADDSLIFARANTQEAYQLTQILHSFSLASGQRINSQKSGLVCSVWVNQALKHQLASIYKVQIWSSPGMYLGIPATWGRAKSQSLNWIMERVQDKVAEWKESLLNQAGKEILVKAVIQAIPTYAMTILKFPMSFCKKLNALVGNFWWSRNHNKRGVHWRKWEEITKSKAEGGMGFRDFPLQNLAHISKQAWRIYTNPEAL